MPHDIKLINGLGSIREYLAGLLESLQTVTDDMKAFGERYTKRAKWNGRKMVLQAALNDEFEIIEEPFIIVETVFGGGEPLFFFEPSELEPVYFSEASENDPVYFYMASEVAADAAVDFIVKIPLVHYTAELDRQVKAETTLFKLAGKTFITVTY